MLGLKNGSKVDIKDWDASHTCSVFLGGFPKQAHSPICFLTAFSVREEGVAGLSRKALVFCGEARMILRHSIQWKGRPEAPRQGVPAVVLSACAWVAVVCSLQSGTRGTS